jgi:hypothetical protein
MATTMEFDPIEASPVEALSESVHGLVCKMDERRFAIPRHFLLAGSEVRKPGDRGKVLIPGWLARSLGVGGASPRVA